MALMTAKELIEKVVAVSKAKTAYMWGTFGRPITDELIERKRKQYQLRYTSARVRKLKALVGKGYFGWDCIGLIKGILWGWDGKVKVPYAANNVPDTNVSGMRQRCTHRSKDFSTIVPGCLLFTTGHVGIYIGGGLAIEATPKWEDGVQITAVTNIGKKAGYNNRKWREHGRLPWIDYAEIKPEPKPDPGSGGGVKTEKVQITAKIGLKVRAGAGTNYKQIGFLKYGTIVEISARKSGKGAGEWGYVPDQGWISLDWVKPVSVPVSTPAQAAQPKKVQVTSKLRLRVRSGPGTNYKQVGSLKSKAIVEITGTKPGKGAKLWGYVPAKKGWISLDYTRDVR